MLLGCVGSARCRAQQLAVPIDLQQGLVFRADRPRTPYLFGARVAPSIDVERVRFGLTLSPLYRNPAWDFGIGASMAWFVPLAARDAGVRFVVQGDYLVRTGAARTSIGVVGELFGLLRIGLWPAFDFDAMRPELCLGLGSDMMSWARVLQDDL